MSHHHMLTPIAYVPEIKPKKIEPRRSRIRLRAPGSIDEADDAEETFEAAGPGLVDAGRPEPSIAEFRAG